MMSVHLESPYVPRRRPFSQLQNIQSPSLSDNDLNVSYGSSESTTKKMLNNSGKPCPRLFATSHSKMSKDFDVSYSSSLDSKNLKSPLVIRPRLRPFTRRLSPEKEDYNPFEVSYMSSSAENTSNLKSPLVIRPRLRPFTRRQSSGKEDCNPFEISYMSSSAENTSNLKSPLVIQPRLRPFTRRQCSGKEDYNPFEISYMSSSAENTSNLKSPLVVRPRLRPFTRRQSSGKEDYNPFEISYMSSSAENTSNLKSPLVIRPRLRPFTRRQSSGKEDYNPFDISYMSSSAENTSTNEISSVNSSIPKLFKNRNQVRNKRRSTASFVGNDSANSGQQRTNELLDDVTYMASPTNSSIKELSFKMPRLFKMSQKGGEDESMFNISYKSSEDGTSNVADLSQLEKSSKLFKGKNDLTSMSSENDVSSLAPCESPESTTVSDAMEVDDVQRASMATRDEYFPELHISKLTNESTASSFNLSASCQAEENQLLPKDNLETQKETVNTSDMLDATNLSNDISSSFLLTPCRKSKITTSAVVSPQKEPNVACSDNEADAVSIDERQKPFVEISSTTMPDVSYNSSKLEINERNSNRNHRLFANHRAAESAFLFNITYNSSIEPNEVSSSNTNMTRSMTGRSLSSSHLDNSEDNSAQNSCTSEHESHVEMSLNTGVSIQVNNSSILNNGVSSSNTTMTRSMSRQLLNNSQLDTSVGMKSKGKSVLNSSVVGHEKRVSMSTPKLLLNTTQPDIADNIPTNDTSIPNDSHLNKSKSVSMAGHSVGSSRCDSTAKIESMDTSKLDTAKSHESIVFSKFDKVQNKLEASMQCHSYIASQETPISTNKLPVAKKLFGRNSGLPDVSFSITYEESVDNTHENTPESLSSSSSEESVVSSEKTSEEESSSDEEEQEESKNEEEKEISSVEGISEKERTIEALEKESSSVEDISEKERINDDLEKECKDAEVMDNQTIVTEVIPEEPSLANSINSYQHQDEEQESLSDGDSSSPEDNFNSSVISQADSDVCRDASVSITDKTLMSSQNNITVLTERPKCEKVTLPKSLDIDDFKEFKKSIEEKIACIRKKAIEKVENKHKFSYPESPRTQKKNTNRKVSTIKKYPRPKLFKPAHWANKRLYDYLSKCLEYKGLNRMLEAEKIVKLVHETIQLVTHSPIYQKNAIQRLKVELATQKIIVTTFDFYRFVREYLPRNFEDKVIPCVQPYTNTVWPPKDNIKESDPIII